VKLFSVKSSKLRRRRSLAQTEHQTDHLVEASIKTKRRKRGDAIITAWGILLRIHPSDFTIQSRIKFFIICLVDIVN